MSAGQLDAAMIAGSLDEAEQAALLALPDGQWSTAPALAETTTLLFGHAIPLIAVMGDWAQPTRIGMAVKRELLALEGARP